MSHMTDFKQMSMTALQLKNVLTFTKIWYFMHMHTLHFIGNAAEMP